MKLNNEQILALAGESGKLSLDIAKLIFGGLILASIVKKDIDSYLLIGIGALLVLFFIVLGLLFIIYSKNNKQHDRKNHMNKRKKIYKQARMLNQPKRKEI